MQLRYVENFKWLTAFLLFDMRNPFSSITCMYNVTSFQLPADKTNGLAQRGQLFIDMDLCHCIKVELVIIDTAEFFLIKDGHFTMFPNKTNDSFFGFGLPVSFPKSVAGLYFF